MFFWVEPALAAEFGGNKDTREEKILPLHPSVNMYFQPSSTGNLGYGYIGFAFSSSTIENWSYGPCAALGYNPAMFVFNDVDYTSLYDIWLCPGGISDPSMPILVATSTGTDGYVHVVLKIQNVGGINGEVFNWDTNKYYYLGLDSLGGETKFRGELGTATNTYPVAYVLADTEYSAMNWTFELPPSTIEMHFPTDNQTSTASNFPYWEADMHVNTSTIAGTMIYARIYFDTATHTSQYSYFIDTNGWPLSSWTGDATVLIPHLTLNPFAFNTTYFAYANILDNTGGVYATSSLISFTTGNYSNMVETSTILTPQFPVEEASSTCTGYGWIGSELCQVGVFLFIPSSRALRNFVNIKNAVANKPPFGYFSEIQTALTGLSNSSTSVIISSSTAATFSSVFGRIRTAMTWILWLVFGFWLFHRIRNFKF